MLEQQRESLGARASSAEALAAALEHDDFHAMVVRRARSPSVSSVDSSASTASCASCGGRRRAAHHHGHHHVRRASLLALPGRAPRRASAPRPAPRERTGLVATATGAAVFVASLGLLQIYLVAVFLLQKLWRAWR